MSIRQQLAAAGAFRRPGVNGNPHTGQTITKNLARRLKDFEAGSAASRIDAQYDRWEQGGFHKPGSLKK